MTKIIKTILAILLLNSIYGIAVAQVNDAFPKFNRAVFSMNQKLDKWVMTPLARTYLKVTPAPVQVGVRNFFSNVAEIRSTGNDWLQGHWYQAFNDGWRFFFNATFGFGGLVDVSSQMGLNAHYTDFGLTLAKWGCRNSSYIVLPLLGPSTLRDTLSIPVDDYGFSVYPFFPLYVRAGGFVLNGVEARAELLQFQGVVDQISFDPYIFQRNAYLQKRNEKIQETIQGTDWKSEAKAFNDSRAPKLLNVYYYQANSKAIF